MTRHLIVSGLVQGVGYRAWVARTASKMGLNGWVRNLADGRVEILVDGPSDVVSQFEPLCRKGPPHAGVTDVKAVDHNEAAVEEGFRVLR